jgi:hypothetical protein
MKCSKKYAKVLAIKNAAFFMLGGMIQSTEGHFIYFVD